MTNQDNQYQRKAWYNSNRETYVDKNGKYVYLILDEEIKDYRREVIPVGNSDITPELRIMLDEMDAEYERRLDADEHHIDKIFEKKKKPTTPTKAVTPNTLWISSRNVDSTTSMMLFVKTLELANWSLLWKS